MLFAWEMGALIITNWGQRWGFLLLFVRCVTNPQECRIRKHTLPSSPQRPRKWEIQWVDIDTVVMGWIGESSVELRSSLKKYFLAAGLSVPHQSSSTVV